MGTSFTFWVLLLIQRARKWRLFITRKDFMRCFKNVLVVNNCEYCVKISRDMQICCVLEYAKQIMQGEFIKMSCCERSKDFLSYKHTKDSVTFVFFTKQNEFI